jgi:citronellol/citronellal dehydrogenase
VQNLLGGEDAIKGSRTPEIMSDAAHVILTSPSRSRTGGFLIDDEVLAAVGITDLEKYAVSPGAPLLHDFFV